MPKGRFRAEHYGRAVGPAPDDRVRLTDEGGRAAVALNRYRVNAARRAAQYSRDVVRTMHPTRWVLMMQSAKDMMHTLTRTDVPRDLATLISQRVVIEWTHISPMTDQDVARLIVGFAKYVFKVEITPERALPKAWVK